jgi:hypothetical protein
MFGFLYYMHCISTSRLFHHIIINHLLINHYHIIIMAGATPSALHVIGVHKFHHPQHVTLKRL